MVVVFGVQESDAVALELQELQREQAGYEQQIQAVDEAIKALQEQTDSMACTVAGNKVTDTHPKVTRKNGTDVVSSP